MKNILDRKKNTKSYKISKVSKKISYIQKRDGRVVAFDLNKIYTALYKAFLAVREKDGPVVKQVSKKVVFNLESLFINKIHILS